MIIQMYQPPSAVRLAKEIARIDELMAQFPLQKMTRGAAQRGTAEEQKAAGKRPPVNLTVNLREHAINVCFRKANEFITETFLKPCDNKIDLKKVQALCNFFKISLPHRYNIEPKKLKSREFQIAAKERILIYIYETINKENVMIKPDATSAAGEHKPPPPFQGDQATYSHFGAPHGGPKEREEKKEESQFLVNPYAPN
jgi:hypothetical protein